MCIDLAGVEKNPSGICVLTGSDAETCNLYTDQEILAYSDEVRPSIIGIDAPLSLPLGRTSIHERNDRHLRACDRELTRHKIRFFPLTLGPMRKLTERGMGLKMALHLVGIEALEVYPGGAQDILGIPRKQRGLSTLLSGLQNLGICGLNDDMSDHELDAVTGAYVMQAYLNGSAHAWGDPAEGIMVMPDISSSLNSISDE
ncbi:MAG: DUF429 domain-containing protein [Candidatus Latescibacteria bacterium]|nr:DUF429 domain-containing protein [Candidatus Latescibacterota bacterium]